VTKPVVLLAAMLAAAPALAQTAGTPPSSDPRWAVLDTYCTKCHNATDWAGGVAFDTMTPADVPHDIDIWEAAVRKLRGNLMPPPGNKQPTQTEKDAVIGWLETSLDARRETPRAGHVTAQRMTRDEYANAVRSLLGVQINANDLLPPEIEVDGFDNIADALTISPSFLDQFIGAARYVAKRAVGNAHAKLGKTEYKSNGESDDLPLGAGAGMAFTHFFPADGEYRLSVLNDLGINLYDQAAAFRRTLVFFVDGREVFRADVGGKNDLGLADKEAQQGRDKVLSRFHDVPIKVTSGPHRIVITSIERSHVLSDENIGGAFGGGGRGGGRLISDVEVSGPYGPTSIGHSESRDRIMVCYPSSAVEERPCAEQIARHLATRAYRRPASDGDVAKLMGFFEAGRKEIGDFDGGVQEIVMGVLSSPDFLFRIVQPKGDASGPQPLSALELASRLSFFLWSDLPDDELLRVAESGRLADPGVYQQQVRRMLADGRAEALVTGFAMRWLNVDDLKAVDPDKDLFRGFNEALRQDFSTEIRMFLEDVLLQNRNVVDLLSADYTFLNDRLAQHYGIRGVLGSQFRRVQLQDPNRYGLLGKAAVLLRTSYGNRTSPVLRGAWVLQTLMGTPPTPPPPGVSTNLDPKDGAKPTTLRERLELHRTNKTCSQCHGVIDPIGLAMENFDVTGAYRTRDSGLPVDASTVLPSGQAVTGVTGLRNVLLSRPDQFVQAITEKLMMYGMGRSVEPADMPQVRAIVHAAAKDDYRFFDLVMGVATSDAFRMQAPARPNPPDKDVKQTVAAAR
jgi:Protein of unknown function (DUF1592)/Protein of unknown function (DUF1588)/Protein of unknown function (DUF1585)/Protein of unknown function (DUF1587)/Protein of unknown function (DUF1595)